MLSISAFWMVTLCSRSATRVKERDWWVLESHQPNASCASTFVTALPASRDGVKGTAMRVHHGGDGGSGCETSCAIRAAQLTPALSLRWMCCVGREIAVLFVRKPQRDSKGSPWCCAGLDKRRKREARLCMLLALRKWEKLKKHLTSCTTKHPPLFVIQALFLPLCPQCISLCSCSTTQPVPVQPRWGRVGDRMCLSRL